MTKRWFITSFVVFALVFALSGAVVVSAQEPTATITPAGQDWLVTGTPMPSGGGFDCPEGNPSDWGTVTPDVWWMAMCGQCVQPSAVPSATVPTSTGAVTITPSNTATGTRSPTPTNTATPTGGLYLYHTVLNLSPFDVTQDSYWYGKGGSVYSPNPAWGVIFQVISSPSNTVKRMKYETVYGGGAKTNMWPDTSDALATGVYCSVSQFINIGGMTGQQICSYLWPGGTYLGSSYNSVGPGTVYVAFQARQSQAGNVRILGLIYKSSSGTPWVSPTSEFPTVTAAPTNPHLCYQVMPVSYTNDYAWDGIQYISGNCFDMGPVDIGEDNPLYSIWETIFGEGSVPGIPWLAHVCLQLVTLGTIQIIGISINLDLVATGLGIFILIRWFTR